jgi:hypothetical protein
MLTKLSYRVRSQCFGSAPPWALVATRPARSLPKFFSRFRFLDITKGLYLTSSKRSDLFVPLRMPQVLGFDVSVEVEGNKLPEYKPEVSYDATLGVPVTTCYIPSEAGKVRTQAFKCPRLGVVSWQWAGILYSVGCTPCASHETLVFWCEVGWNLAGVQWAGTVQHIARRSTAQGRACVGKRWAGV